MITGFPKARKVFFFLPDQQWLEGFRSEAYFTILSV